MNEQEKLERVNYFKPGDKFILEIGKRQLDEYEIAGTDYYIKTFLLKKLIPYNPKEQVAEKLIWSNDEIN